MGNKNGKESEEQNRHVKEKRKKKVIWGAIAYLIGHYHAKSSIRPSLIFCAKTDYVAFQALTILTRVCRQGKQMQQLAAVFACCNEGSDKERALSFHCCRNDLKQRCKKLKYSVHL